MGSLKALFLASMATLAMASTATAADLFLPPPPPIDPGFVPVDFSSGFYLRGDVGAGLPMLRNGISTFENTGGFLTASNGIPPGFAQNGYYAQPQLLFDVGAGYQFNNYFRADVTGEYRFGGYHAYETSRGCFPGSNDTLDGASGLCADRYSANIRSGVFLVNGYIDLGTWYRVTPYLGLGVGTALNTFANLTDYNLNFNSQASGVASSKTTMNLAYALMAGFSYNLNQNWKIDFGYRYLDMGRISSNAIVCDGTPCFFERQSYHLASNDIRLGLRYVFNDDPGDPGVRVPLAPPPPLIRKY